MNIKFKFELSKKQFEDLFVPYPIAYGCGLVRFGGLVGQFVRHSNGIPTLEISDGLNRLPYTIDVPVCKTLPTFKKQVKERITELVHGELFAIYCRSEKYEQMIACLHNAESMMANTNSGHAFLYYNYDAMPDAYTEWQWSYNKMVEHAEYIEVRDKNMDLIHVIDVTGTSVLYSMAQLLEYIASNY